MCLYPQIIRNPRYKPNKKNGGQVPPFHDGRVLHLPIGCGQCVECRNGERRKWQIRLTEDIKTNTNGKFITLTFSNESIRDLSKEIWKNTPPGQEEKTGYALDNAIATIATRRFLERWRKETKKSVRHWLITELGHRNTENIHLHGIVWAENIETIRRKWNYGWIWPREKTDSRKNFVNTRTINYIIKYVHKIDIDHPNYKPIILTSPGIGGNYVNTYDAKLNKYKPGGTIETYTSPNGRKMGMPIYYRNKIYTDDEREKLWIEKLDKQERWICGEKISIKKDERQYYKTLEWYRRINNELGYGTSRKDWTQIKYENERRTMMQETRIRNAK